MSYSTASTLQDGSGYRPRALWFSAPAAAIAYPYTLTAFHSSVASGGGAGALAVAAASLTLAFMMPLIALFAASRLAKIESPTSTERRARLVAFLAIAAPPLYTLSGTVLFMLKNPVPDTWVVTAIWLAAIIAIAAGRRTSAPVPRDMHKAPARVAHGIVALLVLSFIAAHAANHLLGLSSPETHTAVMKALRNFYCAPIVEPLMLVAFLALILSGGYMAGRFIDRPLDRYRTFQIGSGIYLVFFLIGHLSAVLVLARTYLGVESDWAFATGGPAGLIRDAWNIRLVPYYALAVFFALSHPFLGARVVVLAHGKNGRFANNLAVWGIAFSALVSVLIILALCGMRVRFG